MEIADRVFENTRIEVDGYRFARCKFVRCRIVFSAFDAVVFDKCSFTNCHWVFSGSADLTLSFLSDLYRGLGSEGRDLVEAIFESVRNGTIRQDVEQPAVALAR